MILQEEQAAAQLVDLSVVGCCIEHLRDVELVHAALFGMLLSNVTLSQPGASSLLQLATPELQGRHM